MVKKEKKSGATLKKVFVIIAAIVCSILLLSAVVACVTIAVPHFSITMFQEAGISIESGLTFSEFSVGDMIVLGMMWFFPSLAGTILASLALWKLICYCIKTMIKVIGKTFKDRKCCSCSSKEGDKADEHEISGEAE